MTFDEALFTSDPDSRERTLTFLSYCFYGFLLFSVIIFFANRISPATFWPAGFLAPLSPIVFIVNLVLLIYMIFRKPLLAFLPAIVLAIGWPVVSKTYQWANNPTAEATTSFRVLSYNIGFFSVPTVFSKQYSIPDYNMNVTNAISWFEQNNTDILCLQEFFNDDNSAIYNTVETLTSSSDYQYHFVYKDQVKNQTQRGLIILSKFPIVGRGTVFMSENHYNGAIYTDVQTPQGIVRIINVHLESMQLGMLKNNIYKAWNAYRRGVATHARQVDQLMEFIQACPYSILLCGDLNETSYSYVYHQLNTMLCNAFEEAGDGFGITYRGKSLSFLRIDQQFSSPEFNVLRYITHDDVTFSQHRPIEGAYSF